MRLQDTILAVLLGVSGCQRPGTTAEGKAAAHQRQVARRAGDMDRWEGQMAALTREADEVMARYHAAEGDLQVAAATYRSSIEQSAAASTSFAAARNDWVSAKQRWETYQVLVEVAAAVDALNIEKARAAGRGLGALDCSSGMSVAAFRDLLLSRGVNLIGKDIDHIVPRALGGADHPANYRVISSSVNRSWGSNWGPEKCASAGSRCKEAVNVSRRCGSYAGPSF